MYKVSITTLKKVTTLLDKIAKTKIDGEDFSVLVELDKLQEKAKKLSEKIKDDYPAIKNK